MKCLVANENLAQFPNFLRRDINRRSTLGFITVDGWLCGFAISFIVVDLANVTSITSRVSAWMR